MEIPSSKPRSQKVKESSNSEINCVYNSRSDSYSLEREAAIQLAATLVLKLLELTSFVFSAYNVNIR